MKRFPKGYSRLMDGLLTLVVLFLAFWASFFLHGVLENDSYVGMVFVLAVLCIARFTEGYFWGILAALAGVLATNYTFTYPYGSFNFTYAGYPLTIVVMLTVSVLTSALMTRSKLQERLQAETEKERLRANLLRSVSHDLRTPLTSISGTIRLVLEDTLEEETKKALLRQACDEAEWLTDMVENLLSITRIQQQNTLLHKEPQVAEEIIGGAVRRFRNRNRQVAVTIEPPAEVVLVEMDALLMEQVIINLLENAVIHGETTTKITISLHKEGKYLKVLVQDNGKGIATERLSTLFQDTYTNMIQERPDGRRNMGIGLSVCNAIIKAHGGFIDAYNSEEGAVFTVTLPIMEGEHHVSREDSDC